MNDPSLRPPFAAGRGATFAALAAAMIAAAGAGWLGLRLSSLEERAGETERTLREIHRTTQLIRLENRSSGRGIGAVIEQIDFWAPQLASAGTPTPVAETVEAALDECLDAIDALGSRAWPDLVAALEDPGPRDDESRKWLLKGVLRADSGRGAALLAAVVRGTRLAPSPRLRFLAADELLALDRALAGEVLSQVLQVESAQGVTRPVPPGLAPEYERVIGTNQFPEFFNLIDRFVQSEHEDVEAVLRMIIGRPEHDRMTYQVCIRELGKLGSRPATARIKELYANPPGRDVNPLFLTTCLQAIADIEAGDACEWFREQQRSATIPFVQAKLQELVKQLCGGN